MRKNLLNLAELRFASRVRKYSTFIIFLILSIVTIGSFALITPAGWGLDEQAHAPRIYQIAHGNFYPDKNPAGGKGSGGYISDNYQAAFEYGQALSSSVNRNIPAKDRDDLMAAGETERLASRPIDGPERFVLFGAAGPYSPLVYLPAAFGVGLGDLLNLTVGQSVSLARFMQAFAYVMCCLIALYIVRNLRLKWLILAVALLPSSLYQAAVLSADTLTTGVIIIFSASVLAALLKKKQLTRRELILLFIITVLTAFVKQNYALMAIVVAFLPHTLFKSVKTSILYKIACAALWLIFFVIASVIGLQYSDSIAMYRGDAATQISLGSQLMWIITHPFEWLKVLWDTFAILGEYYYRSMIGLFGYNTVAIPAVAMIMMGLLIIFTALCAEAPKKRLQAIYIGGTGIVAALSVVVVLYGTFTPVANNTVEGVQGRYFIPCILFIVYGVVHLLWQGKQLQNIREYWVGAVTSASMVIILALTLSTYVKAMY